MILARLCDLLEGENWAYLVWRGLRVKVGGVGGRFRQVVGRVKVGGEEVPFLWNLQRWILHFGRLA